MIISVEHTISMGHRLPSYNGICSSPHGHNVRFVVHISVKEEAFLDFKRVDNVLKQVLADYDHAMVLHDIDPLLGVLEKMQFRTISLSHEPTTEAIATCVFNAVDDMIQGGRLVAVDVYETSKYKVIAEKRGDVWRVQR